MGAAVKDTNNNQPPRQFGMVARSLLWLSLILAAGCAGTPAPQGTAGKSPAATDDYLIAIAADGHVESGVRSDFDAATTLLEAERYEQGIAVLKRVIEKAPKHTAPYINIAVAYKHTGKLERAEENLQAALAIDPAHPAANNEYGLLCRETGRFEEARDFYQKALAAYPDFHPARKNLGILCDLYLDDPQCALEHYKTYAEAVPADETVPLWIVDLERRTGN